MKLREILFLLLIFIYSSSIYGEDVIFVESIDAIDGCKTFYREVKPASNKNSRVDYIPQKNFKDILTEFSSARENFYRLEIEASLKKFDNIIKSISNSVITNGSLEEIYKVLGESLLYKILIHISKRETTIARSIFTDYYPIISSFPLEEKKFHPSLKAFILENQPTIKSNLSYDFETAQQLKKGLGLKSPYIFDSHHRIPESIEKTNHLLAITIDNGTIRTIIRNFSKDHDIPINIGKNQETYIILVANKDPVKKWVDLYGSEAVYCKEGENLLLLPGGKALSKEEALSRNLKVEIIPATPSEDKKRWYEEWWFYMTGGTLIMGILTSVILLNRGEESNESFKDKVQVK